MDAVNSSESRQEQPYADTPLKSMKHGTQSEEEFTPVRPVETNHQQRVERFFMSHTWLGVCAIQIALTLAGLAILSLDVEKYMHSPIVLTIEAAVVLCAVCDLSAKLVLLGRTAWRRRWFVVDAVQVLLLVSTSAVLLLRETIAMEEMEIILLWVRVILQSARFLLVLARFKNAQNTRKVAADIRLDVQLGGALDRSAQFGHPVAGIDHHRDPPAGFDVFV
jgi:hypothetical protein